MTAPLHLVLFYCFYNCKFCCLLLLLGHHFAFQQKVNLLLQAQLAENVDNVKGQGKPGFFSQILSDLMAPRYGEEDFDPDDSSGESFIEVGNLAFFLLYSVLRNICNFSFLLGLLFI